MEVPKNGVVRDMPEDDYHADPCGVPSLSASIARTLFSANAATAHLEHPRLGGQRAEPKDSWDDGSIIHLLLLGKGAEVCELDFANFRTKEAKAAKDRARAAGKVPVLRARMAALEEAAANIRVRMEALGVAFGPDREISVFWELHGVQHRCRMDALDMTGARVVIQDLKTTKSANPAEIEKTIVNLGYDIQRAAYIEAIETLLPDFVGRVDFKWVFVEIKAPYAVTPMRASVASAQLGLDKWNQARAQWADCVERDDWPCYVTEEAVAQPPYWALKQFYEGADDGE